MRAYVVIGANYGDEGKGLITDALVRRLHGASKPHPTTVVRFNGGAQAGHTVVSGTNRHVFGHLGSGTFAGANTFLASKFIVNPLLLANELAKLPGLRPQVLIDRRARLSTIYDMMLNGAAEMARTQRHGSCGIGINETVTRCADSRYALNVGMSPETIVDTVVRIRKEYLPRRMHELSIVTLPTVFKSVLELDPRQHARSLVAELHAPNGCEGITSIVDSPKAYGTIVMEGAQGLGLDEFLGEFPHVTRSITGLPYAIAAAAELGVTEVVPVYVTRAYLTRHGAGRLPNEGKLIETIPVDTTNVDNQWQGSIRFAPLDVWSTGTMIQNDLRRGEHVAQALGLTLASPKLVVTCLDQSPSFTFYKGMIPDAIVDSNEVGRYLEENIRTPAGYDMNLKLLAVSRGPTATDVNFDV